MNRTTAIIATIVTSLACGIPAFILMCFGVLVMLSTQIPDVMAQNPGSTMQDLAIGAGIFLCFGVVLLFVPILVGVFSFRLSKKEETDMIDYIPPAS